MSWLCYIFAMILTWKGGCSAMDGDFENAWKFGLAALCFVLLSIVAKAAE
jgi:hypothetical protein